eukprot:7459075-Pyramimonas_sp.AAC.2
MIGFAFKAPSGTLIERYNNSGCVSPTTAKFCEQKSGRHKRYTLEVERYTTRIYSGRGTTVEGGVP